MINRRFTAPVEWRALTNSALRDTRDEYERLSIVTPPSRLRLHYTRVARFATLELARRERIALESWAIAYYFVGPFGRVTITQRSEWVLGARMA